MHLQLVPLLTQRWHQTQQMYIHSILFNLARAGTSKRKPILVPSLVVSTHAIPNIFKNVSPLFSSFQQSIKYYYHCSDIRNAYWYGLPYQFLMDFLAFRLQNDHVDSEPIPWYHLFKFSDIEKTDFHHACTKIVIQYHCLPHQLCQRSSTHG